MRKTEGAETQVWIEFAVKCNYLRRAEGAALYKAYDEVLAMIVGMISSSEKWTIQKRD
jgi:four helix bundle protein